ncbi:odorant receptor 46a-like isoform 2-T2 [Cochliomyia hominivorax]
MNQYRDQVKKFYNRQYLLLKCFGVWNLSSSNSEKMKLFYKIYFWNFLIFGMLMFDLAMIMQIVTHLEDVEEIIKALFVLATCIASLGKFLMMKYKRNLCENLFELMDDQKFLPENKMEHKILRNTINLSSNVRDCYTLLSLGALIPLQLTQFLSSIKDLPVHIYLPFDLNTNLKYNLIYFWECIAMGIVCLMNVGCDSLSTTLFIYLKGQLEILGDRLENIGRNLAKATDDVILEQLKSCIRYYNRILNLSHDIEGLLSVPISVQIACSVFVLISNFYAMSLVSLKSSELSYNLYMSDWYNWNKMNRKMVLIMMLRFENPIRIKSINRCYSFNLAAFTSIVNSSYSYFALLKRIND